MSHFLKDILNINEIDIILTSLFSSEKNNNFLDTQL